MFRDFIKIVYHNDLCFNLLNVMTANERNKLACQMWSCNENHAMTLSSIRLAIFSYFSIVKTVEMLPKWEHSHQKFVTSTY